MQNTLLKAYKYSDWAQAQEASIKNFLERISFKVQGEPKGYGHAVYQAKQFIKEEPFLLLLGDYLYVSDIKNKRCAQQLIELAIKEDCSVSAVNPTIEHQINKYGTLTGKVLRIIMVYIKLKKLLRNHQLARRKLSFRLPGSGLVIIYAFLVCMYLNLLYLIFLR